MKLSLYSGITNIAELGDTAARLENRSKWIGRKQVTAAPANLAGLGFTQCWEFEDVGVKAYLRRDRVELIEVNHNFPGKLSGRSGNVFSDLKPDKGKWDTAAIKKFGMPRMQEMRGAASAKGFFYTWGDLEFTKAGLSSISIYRTPEIADYREQHVGDLSFFGR